MAMNFNEIAKKISKDAIKKKIKAAIMSAILAVTAVFIKLLPLIILTVLVGSVLLNYEKEIIHAEMTPNVINDTLGIENLGELIEIKGNDNDGYYWGFKDGIDEKLDDVIEELNRNHSTVSISNKDLLKQMILAQVVTQYPDLGGKSFGSTASNSYGGGNNKVCNLALSQVGTPYIVGGESLEEGGFDCSGLIVWAFQEAGYDWGGERKTANGFAQMGRQISREELQPGDLICEGWDGSKYGHIVMYIGNNQVVGAEAICSLAWNKHTVGACKNGCCVRKREMSDEEQNGSNVKYITLADYYTGSDNVALVSSSNNSNSSDFVTNFLNAAQEITDYVRVNNFKYGNAEYMPPKEDGTTNSDGSKHISCDRLVSWALYKCGYTDQPQNGLCTTVNDSPLMRYCEEKGWLRIDNVNEVQAGDIVFSGSTNSTKTTASHTFICAGENKRYDCGSVNRIQLINGYSSYSSQPFNEPITNFICAYRVTTGYIGNSLTVGISEDNNSFQGAIHLRRVTPNKEVGELEDVSTGVTTQKGTYVEASTVGLGTKEEIPESVKEKMNGKSMPDGASISYDDLSYLTISYYDFNGKVQKGNMIVRKELADEVLLIFQELYNIKYPIYKMQIIDKYDGTGEELDWNSIEANNTSAFCYRNSTGGDTISNHGLGQAIDINPIINPYITKEGEKSSHDVSNDCNYISRNASTWKDETNKWSLEIAKEAEIDTDTEIYKIFKKYGWTWGGDWDSPKDYQHFEKEDLTDVAHIVSKKVDDTDDEESDSEEIIDSSEEVNSYSGNSTSNAGIESKIFDLKYVSKELFKQHVNEGNVQALKEFTIDEDNSNKIIIATWSSKDETITISEKTIEPSNTYTKKYTMPIEYLLAYYIDTRNEEFITELAKLAYDSEFVLAVQDNITTTRTEVFEAVNVEVNRRTIENNKAVGPWQNIKRENGSDKKKSSELVETVSTSVELTYGDTWFVKFYKDINYSSGDLSSYSISNRVNTVQNINGNVNKSNLVYKSSRMYSTLNHNIDDDGNGYADQTKTTTVTTTKVDNITYQYNTGQMNVLGNEQKFIKLYKSNEDFRTSLKPEWVFKILEKQSSEFLDLTKYLFYLARNQKDDYGITEFDFSEYNPEKFSKINLGVSSSDILLDFLKSWENPTVWYYQTDKIGYSDYVAKYITQDKTKYICFDDGLGTRNFGFGVCHYYSGHFNNQDVYASVGVDITQYFNIGSTLDVDIVDQVKLLIVKNNREYINSKLTSAGISLEEHQLQALDAICYQWGPYGTIDDFITAYKKYGDTEALRQNFTHHGDKPFLSGDNARAYEIKRANANWTLFHEGRYLTSDGGELNPTNYSGASKEGWTTKGVSCPRYYQSDERWGNNAYNYKSGGTIRSGGCGASALAMAVSGLTGQDITPDIIVNTLNQNRVDTVNNAAAASQLIAKMYGLTYQRIDRTDKTAIDNALDSGKVCIFSIVANGIYTGGGHFIMCYGREGDNYYVIESARYYQTDTPYAFNRVFTPGNQGVFVLGK